MNRRARHLNPYNLGCQVAFDSRTITPVADSTAVTTWTGRPGTGITADQLAPTQRPLYRTPANGINGQPVLEFDGANDLMQLSGGLAVFQNVGTGNVVGVLIDSNSGDANHGAVVWTTNTTTARATLTSRIGSNPAAYAQARRQDGEGSATSSGAAGSTSSACVADSILNWTGGTIQSAGNGVTGATGALPTSGSTTNTPSSSAWIGYNGLAGAANRFIGKIGAVIACSPGLSEPNLKRIRHSLAFSFRISCA